MWGWMGEVRTDSRAGAVRGAGWGVVNLTARRNYRFH